MIAVVEQNPDPNSLRDETIQEQDDVLVELCASATSPEIPDTLRIYDPRLDNRTLERQVNKVGKGTLILNLSHLTIPRRHVYQH